MAVKYRETPITEERSPRRGAALVSRAALARQQPIIQRLIAFIVMALSFAGAVIWGGGGAERWLAMNPSLVGAAAAFLLQAGCTTAQWIFCDDWWNPWYIIALLVSTTTTLLGFWPLTHEALSGMIQSMTEPSPYAVYYGPWIAGLLIILVAGGLDILPERILTR